MLTQWSPSPSGNVREYPSKLTMLDILVVLRERSGNLNWAPDQHLQLFSEVISSSLSTLIAPFEPYIKCVSLSFQVLWI